MTILAREDWSLGQMGGEQVFNRVILIGRLTRDPELRYTPNGKAVCNFDLAVDGPYTDQDKKSQTVFVRITVWNKLAEICAKNLGKGRKTAVEGKLNIHIYEANDGSKRSATDIVADNVRFLDKPKEIVTQTPGGDLDFSDFGTEVNYSEDEIPF